LSDLNPDARLLIIDDCVSTVSLLRNILSRLGFTRIETVTDSREAVARVEQINPDLIILDLNMPHLDGFTVLSQLRGFLQRGTFLPVLVLTSDYTGEAKRKALLAGASDLVTKPFNPSEIFMRIRNLLQIRFLHLDLYAQNQMLEVKVEERTAELRAMQQQVIVQERLRAFGEMAGGVVHDFNNALMSVIGYSELLLSDDDMLADSKKARHYLTIMNNAGKDASRIIGRLRDFYRPRAMIDCFAPVDLNEVIEQSVPLTQPKWKDEALADGRAISVKLDLAKLPPISGNIQELREIPINLILNAVDAMPVGGTITLRSGCDDRNVLFEISDTGTGMTEQVRMRCLEPFFTTKGDKGAGLGLSTVFGVVKRHEGSIQIDSEPGKGTTVRIRIPAVVQPAVEDAGEAGGLDRSVRVLVVDDDAGSRSIIEGYLRKDGHHVVTATCAMDAIDRAEAETFDLLITDYAMPDMNGAQLASIFREERTEQPVILMTGFAPGGVGPEEESTGVDLVMRKPVSRQELRRAMVSVMGAGCPALEAVAQ
jgi:signal transduction histidine kinase